MATIELDYNGEMLYIEYNIIDGEPEQWYDQFGNPGTPGVSDDIEIECVSDMHGNDRIDKYDIYDLEEKIWDQLNGY